MDGFMMDTGPSNAYLLYSNILEKYASLAAGISSEDDYNIGKSVTATNRKPAFEPCRQGETLMESAEKLNEALRQKRHALGLPEEWEDLVDDDEYVALDDLSEIFEDESQVSDSEDSCNIASKKKSKNEDRIKKKEKKDKGRIKKKEKELHLNKKKKSLSSKICKTGNIKLNRSFKGNRSFKKNKDRTSLNTKLDKNKKAKISLSSKGPVKNPYFRFSMESNQNLKKNRSARLKQRVENINIQEKKKQKQAIETKRQNRSERLKQRVENINIQEKKNQKQAIETKRLNRSERLKQRVENINIQEKKNQKQAIETKLQDDLEKVIAISIMETSLTIGEKVRLKKRNCLTTRNSALVEKKTKPTKYSNENNIEKESIAKSKHQTVKELKSKSRDNNVNDGQLHSNEIDRQLHINEVNVRICSDELIEQLQSEVDISKSPNSEGIGILHTNDYLQLQSKEDNVKLPQSKEDIGNSSNIEDNGHLHINDGNQLLHNKEDNGQLQSEKDNSRLPNCEDTGQLQENEDIDQLQSNNSNGQLLNDGNGNLQISVNNDEILTNEDNEMLHSNENNGQQHTNLLQVEEKLEPVKKNSSRNQRSVTGKENKAENNIKTIKGKSRGNAINQDNEHLSNREGNAHSDSNKDYIKQRTSNEFGKNRCTFYRERSKNKLSSSNKKISPSSIALIGLTYLRKAYMKVYENDAHALDLKQIIKFLKEKELEKLLMIKLSTKSQISSQSKENKKFTLNSKENKDDSPIKNVINFENPVKYVDNVVENSKRIEKKSAQIRSDKEKAPSDNEFVIDDDDYSTDSGLPKEIQCLSEEENGVDLNEVNVQKEQVPIFSHSTEEENGLNHDEVNVQDEHVPNINLSTEEENGLNHDEVNVREEHVPNTNHSTKVSMDKQLVWQFCQREGHDIEEFNKFNKAKIAPFHRKQNTKAQLNENDFQVVNEVENFQSRSNNVQKRKDFNTLIELKSSNVLKNKEWSSKNKAQQKIISEKEKVCQDLIVMHTEINLKTPANTVEDMHQKQGETHEFNLEVNSQFADASKKKNNSILCNEDENERMLNNVYEDINKKNYEDNVFSLEHSERDPKLKANEFVEIPQNQLSMHELNSEVNTKDMDKNKDIESKTVDNEDETISTMNIVYEDMNEDASTQESNIEKSVRSPIKLNKNIKLSDMKSKLKVNESNVNKAISKGNKNKVLCNTITEKKISSQTYICEHEDYEENIEKNRVEGETSNCKINKDYIEIENRAKKSMVNETLASERTNDKAEKNTKENQNIQNENRKNKNKKIKTKRILKSSENTSVKNIKNSDDMKENHYMKHMDAKTDASKTNNKSENNDHENLNLVNEKCKKKNKKSKTKTADRTRIAKKGENKEVENLKNSNGMNKDIEVKRANVNCDFSMENNTINKKIVTELDICDNFECEKSTIKTRTKAYTKKINKDKKDMDIENYNMETIVETEVSQRTNDTAENNTKENQNLGNDGDIENLNAESLVETEASQGTNDKEEINCVIEDQNLGIGNYNKKNDKTKMSNIESRRKERIDNKNKLKSRFRCQKKMNYYESCDDIDYETDVSENSWKDSKLYMSSEINDSGNNDKSNSEFPAWKKENFNGINKIEKPGERNAAWLNSNTKTIIGDNEKSINGLKVKKSKLRLKYYVTPPKILHKTIAKKGKANSLSSKSGTNYSKNIINKHSSNNKNICSLNQSHGSSLSPNKICSQKNISNSSPPTMVDHISVDNFSDNSSSHTEKNQNLSNSSNDKQLVNPLNVIGNEDDVSKSLCHRSVDRPQTVSHNILQANSSDVPVVPESKRNKAKTNSDNEYGSIDRNMKTSDSKKGRKKKLRLANCVTPPISSKKKERKNAKNSSLSSSSGSVKSFSGILKKNCSWERMTDNSHNTNVEQLTMSNLSKDASTNVDKMQHISESTKNTQVRNNLSVMAGNEDVCRSLTNSSDISQRIGCKNVVRELKDSGISAVSESTHDPAKDNSKNKDADNKFNSKDPFDDLKDYSTNQDLYNKVEDNSRNKDVVDSKVNTISRKSFEISTGQIDNSNKIDYLNKQTGKKGIDMHDSETGCHKETEMKGNSLSALANVTEIDSRNNCVDLRNMLSLEKLSEDVNVNVLPKESAIKKNRKLGDFLKPHNFKNDMTKKKTKYIESLNIDYKKLSEDTIIAGIDLQKKKRKHIDHMIFDSTHKNIAEGKAAFCSIAELRKINREALGIVPNKSTSQISKGIDEISAIEAETTEKIPKVNVSEQIVANSNLINGIGYCSEIETTEKLPSIRENEEETFQTVFKGREMSKRCDISKCLNSSDEDATATLLGLIRPQISSHSYPSISSMASVARTKSQSSVSEISKNSSTASSVAKSVSGRIRIKSFMDLDDSDNEDAFMNNYISTSNKGCHPVVSIPPPKRPRIESNASESGFESGYTHCSTHLSNGYTTRLTQNSSRLSNCQSTQKWGSTCSSALKKSLSFKKPRLKIAKPR